MEYCSTVEQIRQYRDSSYDHRPYLPPGVNEKLHSEEFRVGYACFKRQVTAVLKPKIIFEIGVGLGISALAFMNGSPFSYYYGIDNDLQDHQDFPITPTKFVNELLQKGGYKYLIENINSQEISNGPIMADLVHVDADHSREATKHDVMVAWRSTAPRGYILIDDTRDSNVTAGVFDAIADIRPGSLDWAYFEDTYTGNILISKHKERL